MLKAKDFKYYIFQLLSESVKKSLLKNPRKKKAPERGCYKENDIIMQEDIKIHGNGLNLENIEFSEAVYRAELLEAMNNSKENQAPNPTTKVARLSDQPDYLPIPNNLDPHPVTGPTIDAKSSTHIQRNGWDDHMAPANKESEKELLGTDVWMTESANCTVGSSNLSKRKYDDDRSSSQQANYNSISDSDSDSDGISMQKKALVKAQIESQNQHTVMNPDSQIGLTSDLSIKQQLDASIKPPLNSSANLSLRRGQARSHIPNSGACSKEIEFLQKHVMTYDSAFAKYGDDRLSSQQLNYYSISDSDGISDAQLEIIAIQCIERGEPIPEKILKMQKKALAQAQVESQNQHAVMNHDWQREVILEPSPKQQGTVSIPAPIHVTTTLSLRQRQGQARSHIPNPEPFKEIEFLQKHVMTSAPEFAKCFLCDYKKYSQYAERIKFMRDPLGTEGPIETLVLCFVTYVIGAIQSKNNPDPEGLEEAALQIFLANDGIYQYLQSHIKLTERDCNAKTKLSDLPDLLESNIPLESPVALKSIFNVSFILIFLLHFIHSARLTVMEEKIDIIIKECFVDFFSNFTQNIKAMLKNMIKMRDLYCLVDKSFEKVCIKPSVPFEVIQPGQVAILQNLFCVQNSSYSVCFILHAQEVKKTGVLLIDKAMVSIMQDTKEFTLLCLVANKILNLKNELENDNHDIEMQIMILLNTTMPGAVDFQMGPCWPLINTLALKQFDCSGQYPEISSLHDVLNIISPLQNMEGIVLVCINDQDLGILVNPQKETLDISILHPKHQMHLC